MRVLTVMPLLIFLALLSPLLQAGGQKQANQDEETIVGTWEMSSGQREGEKLRGDDTFRFTFKADGQFKVIQKGPDGNLSGTYKLDPKKQPKEIDLVVKEKTFKGIYTLETDKLTLCLGEIEKARPTEFIALKGKLTTLMMLRRTKANE